MNGKRRWLVTSLIVMGLTSPMLVEAAAPSAAVARTLEFEATLTCPDGEVVVETVSCVEDETLKAIGLCSDGRKVEAQLVCHTPSDVVAHEHTDLEERLSFLEDLIEGFGEGVEYRLGAGYGYLDVYGHDQGPESHSLLLSLQARRYFRSSPRLFLTIEGVGTITKVAGDSKFGFADFGGLGYQLSEDWTVVLGGRHQFAFDQQGDEFNSLLGEVQAHCELGKGLSLQLRLGWGKAYHQASNELVTLNGRVIDSDKVPSWAKPPNLVRSGKVEGATSNTIAAGIGLGWRF